MGTKVLLPNLESERLRFADGSVSYSTSESLWDSGSHPPVAGSDSISSHSPHSHTSSLCRAPRVRRYYRVFAAPIERLLLLHFGSTSIVQVFSSSIATAQKCESNPPPPSSAGPLYPKVLDSNPDLHSPFLSNPAVAGGATSSLYPSVDMHDLVQNLFPNSDTDEEPKGNTLPDMVPTPALTPPEEEMLIRVPGAILHLIDADRSVELGAGDFSVVRLRQGDNTIAVLARLGPDGDLIQWPLARDEAAVKLDDAHYFFSLHVPHGSVLDEDDGAGAAAGDGEDHMLNYGLTFASKGQEAVLKELDAVLNTYSSFSAQKVEVKAGEVEVKSRDLNVKKKQVPVTAVEVLDASVAKEVTPAEALGPKKKMMEERSAVYWTTLAPNVEDYGTSLGKLVAKGSGQLIKGIMWSGEVAVDRLKWTEEVLKQRIEPGAKPKEISKKAIRRMRRVRRLTKMTNKVANGILHGVLKVTGFFTSAIINSKPGQKFFSLLPGEVALLLLMDSVPNRGLVVMRGTIQGGRLYICLRRKLLSMIRY